MKGIIKAISLIIIIFVFAGTAMGLDINALDRVSVLMNKSGVYSLLGNPDETGELREGLKVDIYKLKNMDPLVGVGCIYEDDQRLAGQAFVFQGEMGREAAEKLKGCKFTLTEEKEGTFRFLGKDDDTGQSLVVYIVQDSGLTVVMTFEKGFYDRRVKSTTDGFSR